MGLTALAIRNAKPRAKPYKLTDERSFSLMVMPNGAKYWRLVVRTTKIEACSGRQAMYERRAD